MLCGLFDLPAGLDDVVHHRPQFFGCRVTDILRVPLYCRQFVSEIMSENPSENLVEESQILSAVYQPSGGTQIRGKCLDQLAVERCKALFACRPSRQHAELTDWT